MLLRPRGVLGSGSHPALLPACVPALLPGSVPAFLPGSVPVREGVRLAVDVGSVRVGVARSDPGGILATPLTMVSAGPGAQAELAKAELAKLAAGAGAIEVIVGLPTSLSGREGAAAAAARTFAADLAERLAPIPVRLGDEPFTTTQAPDPLRPGGKRSPA